MGLLAPLYILGILTISVPIILHLIRRTPQGRQVFSSLMFLSASPPRLTRRSRLTHILLLILRATALIVLAMAFARPFLHGAENFEPQPSSGRRIALLVDTSASMRRGDLWKQATANVEDVLRDVSAADEVGLYFFDQRVRPGLSFEEWNQADAPTRIALLRARLAAAAPGWQTTRLGDALLAAEDLVSESSRGTGEGKSAHERNISRRIVLISDLQKGGHIEALQSREWPQDVELFCRPVVAAPPGNANLEWVTQAVDDAEKPDRRLRVRVSNQADSREEQFAVTWGNGQGSIATIGSTSIYVAPGRSQIVRIAPAPEDQTADRLILAGDHCDFDNTLFVAAPRIENVRVVYLGDEAANDTGGIRYYLQTALSDSPQRRIEMTPRRAGEMPGNADLLDARLVVVASGVADASADRLRSFLESGGDVLWVLKDAGGAASLARAMGESLDMHEAATADFALLARIDLTHPLFAPFSDARFGDFTKIHFWKHRALKPTDPQTTARVLAAFDNGDPFLIEKTFTRAGGGDQGARVGRLLIMTSGWQPLDSQLALSTKFVPLMEGILRRRDDVAVGAQYLINESIPLPKSAGTTAEKREMIQPDGTRIDLGNRATFDGTTQPGIYRLSIDGQETSIAVNLSPEESRTEPFPAEEFEQYGIKLGAHNSASEAAASERRLHAAEMENRQKLWRWLILGVLGLLAVETALAGRMARRASNQQAVP